MKKVIYFFASLILISLLITACGKSEADKEAERKERKFTENPISWNNYSVSERVPFDKDTLHVNYQIDIEYRYPQEYTSEAVQKKLINILNTEIWGEIEADIDGNYPDAKTYVDSYIKDRKDGYLDQLTEMLPIWNGRNGDSIFNEVEKISTEIVFNRANLVSYQIINQARRGNNDSVPYDYTVRNLVLDVAEAKQLKESDIFRNGYKEELNKRIVSKILSDLNIRSTEQLASSKYWGVGDIAANNNFVITQDNLCYTFNCQEYADKSEGLITVCFTYDELKDLFSPNSPLYFFVNNGEDKIENAK